jgi:hypothetical protein
MNEFLWIGLFLIGWIALNRWILPAMGIETCMSGGCCGSSCQTSPDRSARSQPTDQDGRSNTQFADEDAPQAPNPNQ